MPIEVDSWTIQTIKTNRDSGTLILSPEYQRRETWKPKDRMLLVDSIAREVPIGAITLYADDSKGYTIHEVIDGKQRLQAIFEFLEDKLEVRTSTIEKSLEDDEAFAGDDDATVKIYHNKTFSDVEVPDRLRFQQYKIPLFVVKGSRADAVRAFVRMNQNSYWLKPQELRNALFAGTSFLKTSIEICEELATAHAVDSYFVNLGIVSPDGYSRMQDVQFASELLLLLLHGAQNRRDSLDNYYELYRAPTGEAAKGLKEKKELLIRILSQLWEVVGGVRLQGLHFPSSCENDVYGIVGAFGLRGTLSTPQLRESKDELASVVSYFRQQVELYVEKVRDPKGAIEPGEFAPLVEDYGKGFLGGQPNSKPKREDRALIWAEVINGVVSTLDPKASFSEMQRRFIWARSPDKICVRCNDLANPVTWDTYHAGHRVPRSKGGRTVIENGQVEHKACNLAAGAD